MPVVNPELFNTSLIKRPLPEEKPDIFALPLEVHVKVAPATSEVRFILAPVELHMLSARGEFVTWGVGLTVTLICAVSD